MDLAIQHAQTQTLAVASRNLGLTRFSLSPGWPNLAQRPIISPARQQTCRRLAATSYTLVAWTHQLPRGPPRFVIGQLGLCSWATQHPRTLTSVTFRTSGSCRHRLSDFVSAWRRRRDVQGLDRTIDGFYYPQAAFLAYESPQHDQAVFSKPVTRTVLTPFRF